MAIAPLTAGILGISEDAFTKYMGNAAQGIGQIPMTMLQAQQGSQSPESYAQQAMQGAANQAMQSIHERAKAMFLARLGGIEKPYIVKPHDFFWTHVDQSRNTVYVFFLINGQAGNTSESANMFPSDTLITQFRVLVA